MIMVVRQPFLPTYVTELLLTYTTNVVTPDILVNHLLAGGTGRGVVHLKIDKSRVSQFLPIFLVKAFARLVVLVPAFGADKVAALLTLKKLEHFLYLKTCVAAEPFTPLA